jgi:hypothetical protein
MESFVFVAIFCMIIFSILTVRYFIMWLHKKAELNSFLGWLCAFMWCVYSLLLFIK